MSVVHIADIIILWPFAVTTAYCNMIFLHLKQRRTEGGGLGGSTPPPPNFRSYWWSPRSHEKEELASRFHFVAHCVLIWL